jgi:HJR/Mrr/RecB family endonuclease
MVWQISCRNNANYTDRGNMKKFVTKASGEKEAFSKEKFQRSLRKSGASQDLIEQLTQQVMQDPSLITTQHIYKYAFNQLRKRKPAAAARYNLKAALSELGPHGFPFEKFVAEIFKKKGFETTVNQIVPGFCVNHEIDIILKKDNHHFMVECKFHSPHLKVNIKVPLYIKARFDDLTKKHLQNKQDEAIHQAWIVTNTKFTSEATAYGECVDIKMIGWSYPTTDSLAHLIDQLGLHPVTALTSLSRKQKRMLIEEGFVLCKDAAQHRKLLRNIGLNDQKIELVVQESEEICELGAINNN